MAEQKSGDAVTCGGADIRIRNIRFDLSGAPRRWHAAGAGVTAFFDALSICFPLGEQFFIRSVKRAQAALDDPALAVAVKGFAGQEAVHTREHQAYNERLRAAGCEVDAMERELARTISWIEEKLGDDRALGVTACVEHLTSVLSAQITHDDAYLAGADAAMRDLWVWHAMEEAEHGHVAFDVLAAKRPGYLFRVQMMLLSTRLFLDIVARNVNLMARKERERGMRRGLLAYLIISPGLARRSLPAYFAWYRPGFHPSQSPARARAARHRARYDARAGLPV
ncbi:MAG: metal-dependent hydrolase [Pseudomonadota bacterium]